MSETQNELDLRVKDFLNRHSAFLSYRLLEDDGVFSEAAYDGAYEPEVLEFSKRLFEKHKKEWDTAMAVGKLFVMAENQLGPAMTAVRASVTDNHHPLGGVVLAAAMRAAVTLKILTLIGQNTNGNRESKLVLKPLLESLVRATGWRAG